jgi:arsenate reductase
VVGKADSRPSVLFICRNNSARSQMAEGLMRHLYKTRFEVRSGGIEPTRIREGAVKAMNEIGIDISGQRSKSLAEFQGQHFDYVVTVCEEGPDACPWFRGGKVQIHKAFEDPAAFQGPMSEEAVVYRRVREEIRSWLVSTFGGKS